MLSSRKSGCERGLTWQSLRRILWCHIACIRLILMADVQMVTSVICHEKKICNLQIIYKIHGIRWFKAMETGLTWFDSCLWNAGKSFDDGHAPRTARASLQRPLESPGLPTGLVWGRCWTEPKPTFCCWTGYFLKGKEDRFSDHAPKKRLQELFWSMWISKLNNIWTKLNNP